MCVCGYVAMLILMTMKIKCAHFWGIIIVVCCYVLASFLFCIFSEGFLSLLQFCTIVIVDAAVASAASANIAAADAIKLNVAF